MSFLNFIKNKISETKPSSIFKSKLFWFGFFVIFLSSFFGFLAGIASISLFLSDFSINVPFSGTLVEEEEEEEIKEDVSLSQERAIIKAVEEVWPAVVSIVVTKDVPVIEQYFYNPFEEFEYFFGEPLQVQIPQYRQKGTEKREVGGGTGFIISEEGLVLTNKHVVLDEDAHYTIFTNDGRDYSVEVIARNPILDIAVLKIEEPGDKIFPTVKIGDSEELQLGQTVIAIGNALTEFRNTVSVGVVSGLGRTITASGGGIVETLEDVIQTDAAINRGNSGGPLLNIRGEVVGINTAMALEAQNIGFAIPINQTEKSIEQVKTLGKIVYPFLGIRYILINEQIQKENNLAVNYGAWVMKGARGEPAVYPGSAAEEAGLRDNDIVLEFNNQKISLDNSLAKIIMQHNPGDKVNLKVLRGQEEKNIEVILGEKSE